MAPSVVVALLTHSTHVTVPVGDRVSQKESVEVVIGGHAATVSRIPASRPTFKVPSTTSLHALTKLLYSHLAPVCQIKIDTSGEQPNAMQYRCKVSTATMLFAIADLQALIHGAGSSARFSSQDARTQPHSLSSLCFVTQSTHSSAEPCRVDLGSLGFFRAVRRVNIK